MTYPVGLLDEMANVLEREDAARRRADARAKSRRR